MGRILFDENWRFTKQDVPDGQSLAIDHTGWDLVDLPHQFGLSGGWCVHHPAGENGAYLPGAIGWYRKEFEYFPIADEVIMLEFDGVFHHSTIWLNGNQVGGHGYGFVPFSCDLTPFLKKGENLLAVRVDASLQPTARWYCEPGICRHVHLGRYAAVHIPTHGLYIKQRHSSSCVFVGIEAEIVNPSGMAYEFRAFLLDDGQSEIVSGIAHNVGTMTLEIEAPNLWSADQPYLYSMRCEIWLDGNLSQVETCRIGFREIAFTQDGLFVNSVPSRFRGVCLHTDGGCIAAGVPRRIWAQRLAALKGIGVNAIRFSHNPPATEFMDLCDRLGFYVINEAFDKWKSGYYKQLFDDCWKEDLTAILRRDRNHPSVVLWSVGNEVGEQFSEAIFDTLPMLINHVHAFEPTRPVTCALMPAGPAFDGSDEEKLDALLDHLAKAARHMDVYSGNYQEQWYDLLRERYPEIIIIGSETFPYYKSDKHALKAYREPSYPCKDRPFVLGEFIWVGINYWGEGGSWPCKGWSAGLFKTTGEIRPIGRRYQSQWSDRPTADICVHDTRSSDGYEKSMWNFYPMSRSWNHEGAPGFGVDVTVFSNCEAVELILNGDRLGMRESSDVPNRMFRWYVPYKKGELKAVGYIGGKAVCQDRIITSGTPDTLSLHADSDMIPDDQEVFCVVATITDASNIEVCHACPLIHFEIFGPGDILGVDNGNMMSDQPLATNWGNAHDGKLMAYIRPRAGSSGKIKIVATSPELKPATLVLKFSN